MVTLLACKFFSNPDTNPEAGVVLWLPPSYQDVEGDEVQMGSEEKRWLPKDTSFFKFTYPDSEYLREARRLRELGGRDGVEQAEMFDLLAKRYGLSATLIVAGSDSRSLHRPEVCLRAQGWAITKREVVVVETTAGPLEVMDYHLSMIPKDRSGNPYLDEDGQPVKYFSHYVFWWVGPGATTPSYKEKVISETFNSILKGRRERWAYPSVMVWENPNEGKGAQAVAQKKAYSYIAEVAPDFQRSLGAKEREGVRPLKSVYR